MKTLATIALVALTGSASAQFNYQSQSRFVEAMARDLNSNLFFDSKSASGFEFFNEVALVAVEPTFGEGSQTSSLDAFAINASGSASGAGINGFGGSARSFFRATFSIAEPTAFDFSSSVNPGFGSTPSVRFTGPGGTLSSIDGFNTFSDTLAGTLDAGTYTIVADAQAAGAGIPDNGGFNVSLTIVPAPASVAALALGGFAAARRRR